MCGRFLSLPQGQPHFVFEGGECWISDESLKSKLKFSCMCTQTGPRYILSSERLLEWEPTSNLNVLSVSEFNHQASFTVMLIAFM